MKKNLTEIVFVLNRSGSMTPLEEDTIGGFNEFIEKQRKIEGEAYITTVLFDTSYQVLHEHVALDEVKPLTKDDYSARGGTALLDAVGRTIDNLGVCLSNTPEEERPEHVIFVITTDGEENSSMSYSLQKVREMIAHQQEKYSWQFIFLGANMDAVSEAGKLGICASHAANFTPSHSGVRNMYSRALNDVVYSARIGFFDIGSDWKSSLETDEK